MKKPTNKQQPSKRGKSRKRYTSINDLPKEIQEKIKNMKVSYTVHTVGEYIHPDVKARLEEEKKTREG